MLMLQQGCRTTDDLIAHILSHDFAGFFFKHIILPLEDSCQ